MTSFNRWMAVLTTLGAVASASYSFAQQQATYGGKYLWSDRNSRDLLRLIGFEPIQQELKMTQAQINQMVPKLLEDANGPFWKLPRKEQLEQLPERNRCSRINPSTRSSFVYGLPGATCYDLGPEGCRITSCRSHERVESQVSTWSLNGALVAARQILTDQAS